MAVACDVYDGVFLCCPFSHEGVLDEILNLIQSVSEGFPSYSYHPFLDSFVINKQTRYRKRVKYLFSHSYFFY